MRIRLALMTAFVMTGLAAGIVNAQPLADVVPSDALVYAGWTGGKNLAERGKGTHMEAVVKATKMPERVKDAFEKLAGMAANQDPDSVMVLDVLRVLGGATWENPVVFYLVPGTGDGKIGPDEVPLGFVVRWRADADAPALVTKIQGIIDHAAKDGDQVMTPVVKQVGPYVVLHGGHVDTAVVNREKPAASLKDNADFKKAFAVVGKEASCAMAFYMDAKGGLALINQGIERDKPAGAQEQWETMRDALSLGGVKSVVWAGGFEGKDWVARTFIDAPTPRKGLVEMMEGAPIAEETLKLVPKGSVWMNVFQFDLQKIVDQVQQIARSVDPDADQGLARVFEGAKQASGVDVKQFIGSIGPEWVLYADPALGGSVMNSMVATNRLRNPAAFKTELAALHVFVNHAAANSRDGFKFRIDTVKQGDLEFHTVNLMMFAPSWTVRGDMFYAGLTPQTVEAAATDTRQNGSILDNAEYVAVMKRLGGKDFTSLGFVDLPKTAAENYQGYNALAQFLGGMMQQQGLPNPLPGLIPPLPTITSNLAPGASAGWSDGNGFYNVTISPFPGAKFFGPDGVTTISSTSMMVGIMLPALGAARRTANQMKSNAHLRRIHQAMIMYANEHGIYPANMGVLLDQKYVTRELLVSPVHKIAFPANFDKFTTEEKGKWLSENGAYVILVWGQKPTNNAETIIGYLKPSHFPGNGVSVVYGDNHAEWNFEPGLLTLLKEQYPNHKPQGFDEHDGHTGHVQPAE